MAVLDAGVQKLFCEIFQLSFLNDCSTSWRVASNWRMAVHIDLFHEELDVGNVPNDAILFIGIDLENLKIVNQRMADNGFAFQDFLNLKNSKMKMNLQLAQYLKKLERVQDRWA